MTSLIIIGRRWRNQKSIECHTIDIFVDGIRKTSPRPILYGDYENTAFDWLEAHGYIPRNTKSLLVFARENRISLYMDIINVRRRKDL